MIVEKSILCLFLFHWQAKRAEDFYQSFGLPAMTDTFWRESVFTRENKDTRCHGAAADMFKDGDFRSVDYLHNVWVDLDEICLHVSNIVGWYIAQA